MYRRRPGNTKSKQFALECKIVEELRSRLEKDGDGFTRIKMKEDGQEIDIYLTVDNKYMVTFPPYYDASKRDAPYKALSEHFDGLDEVAEFLINKEWQVTYN